MKIAVKQFAFGSCLLALGILVGPIAVHSYAEAMPSASATSGIPAVAAPLAAPAPAAANNVPKLVSPATNAPAPTIVAAADTKLPDLAVPLPTPTDKKDIKVNDPVNTKVPDSVKDVIKKLNIKTEDVTLDDLNNAREAVAKLDALIDIEKRLADLEKIKHEREENDKTTLMAALPASALAPPPAYMPPQQPQQMPVFTPPPANIDVVRIEGSNHRYAALIKEGENTRLVHAGEKLNDGTTVVSVTARGVELQRGDKAARLVAVKDVETVFGTSP